MEHISNLEQFIPIALAAGAVVQIVKETGKVQASWILRSISVVAGGLMGFFGNGDIVGGMAAGGLATVFFAAVKLKLSE